MGKIRFAGRQAGARSHGHEADRRRHRIAAPPLRGREAARRDQTIDGVQVESSVGNLRITRPWAKAAGYGMLLWIAMWYGVVGFFTSLGAY